MELPSKDTMLKLYRDLLTARRAEAELHSRGGISGHRMVGEEAISIAICNNLTETDCFHPSFRTQPCIVFKPGFVLADWLAPGTKGSTKNIWLAPEGGVLATSGTLGEASLKFVGAAVAASILKTGDVTVFSQGDGASNRAPTHEAMAVASAWKLPIVFVIHNNKYGMGTSVETSYGIEDLSLRGVGYGFPSERVDGNDMLDMYLVAKKHIDRVRAGGGPSLIAADTYRVMPHYGGDLDTVDKYRPEGEAKEWMQYDPLPRYQKQLLDLGVLTEGDIDQLEEEIHAEILTILD
ncbi:MAG: thiamine pyrophosphate-dependent dehydrogenase E1 component subunit alpha [Desulfobacterales bacterium]